MKFKRVAAGQAMPEFLLPLLLALLLALLSAEAARVKFTTLALRGVIRDTGVFAASGQWSPEAVESGINVETDTPDATLLDALVPCTQEIDVVFATHWGMDCDPADPTHQALRADMARLISITEVARKSARERGLFVMNGYVIPGLFSPNGPVDDTHPYDTVRPGYMQVWICSSRLSTDPTYPGTRYEASGVAWKRRCAVMQPQSPTGPDSAFGPLPQTNQYDAGGPGDTVEIVITYNMPLTPPAAAIARQLGLRDYIPVTVRIALANNPPETFGGVLMPDGSVQN
ncbi:MAG: hypothetical protein K8L91_03365 [Anaerolineae bacterium]|nr:hypothetical protein [Anaerolineae bacterium]